MYILRNEMILKHMDGKFMLLFEQNRSLFFNGQLVKNFQLILLADELF